MMTLSPQLKSWLIENGLAYENSSDDKFRMAAAEAWVADKMSTEKYRELVLPHVRRNPVLDGFGQKHAGFLIEN